MLAKRIIATILVRGSIAYKGQRFNSDRSIGSALAVAKVHARRGVDELVILDVAATAEGRGPSLDLVTTLTTDVFIPVTVGGGVRSLGHIDALLRAGADKVAICTGLSECDGLLYRAAQRFGAQALVACLDECNGHAWKRNGTVQEGPIGEVAWACEQAGAGEILLQSLNLDGTMSGYDLALIKRISDLTLIPVIASGGCSGYADMLDAFKAGADGCAAGALWAFTDSTPKAAAQHLKARGVEVRV